MVELVIQIVIIYLILIVLVAVQAGLAQDLPTHEVDIDPLEIQTGDILGVGYRNPFGWFVTAWSFSVWSHTGVAWRSPITNELYVFEAARYDNPSLGKIWNGVFRIPFDLWLRINRNSYLCHLRLQSATIQDEDGRSLALKMEDVCKELEQINLDVFNWEWYRFLYTKPYVEESLTRHYTCFEITVLLLQKLGIAKKQHACSSYFARDIVWRHLPMEQGFSYTNPVLLRYQYMPT